MEFQEDIELFFFSRSTSDKYPIKERRVFYSSSSERQRKVQEVRICSLLQVAVAEWEPLKCVPPPPCRVFHFKSDTNAVYRHVQSAQLELQQIVEKKVTRLTTERVTWRTFAVGTMKREDSTSWLRERKKEGWIKLDPPVPKELAIATGSSQAIFNNRGTGNPWAGHAEKLLRRCDSRSNR